MNLHILTVTKNSEAVLAKCLESVACQRQGLWSSISHSIIDGGSSDQTLKVAKSFANDYHLQIKAITDNSLYEGMNNALRHLARGEYFIFLNSDDFFVSESILELVAKLLTEHSLPDVLCAKVRLIDGVDPLRVVRVWDFGKMDESADPLEFGFPAHTGMVISSDIIINNQLFFDTSYLLASDHDWIIRLFKKVKTFAVAEDLICNMRIGGKTSQGFRSLVVQNYEIWKIRTKYYSKRSCFCYFGIKFLKGWRYVLEITFNRFKRRSWTSS